VQGPPQAFFAFCFLRIQAERFLLFRNFTKRFLLFKGKSLIKLLYHGLVITPRTRFLSYLILSYLCGTLVKGPSTLVLWLQKLDLARSFYMSSFRNVGTLDLESDKPRGILHYIRVKLVQSRL